MLTANVIALCSFILTRFALNIPMLYIGRLLIGYTNGIWTSAAPLYTGEINQPKLRKFTGALFNLSFNVGYTLLYIIGAVCDWRDVVVIVSIWPCINFLLLFFCPESPTWLILRERKMDAIQTLKKIRGNDKVAELEILRMEMNIQAQRLHKVDHSGSSSVREKLNVVMRGTFMRPFLVLSFILTIGVQWSGGPAMAFYLVEIIEGFKIPMSAYWAAAAVTIYRLSLVIISAVIATFVPRRPHFLCCIALTATGTLILGTCGFLHQNENYVEFQEDYPFTKWIPAMGIILMYTGFCGGVVTITFALLGELLPSNARGIGTTLVITLSNISFFTATKLTTYLKETLGLHGMFWLFSGISYSSGIVAYFCVPETFGKSLESIEQHYRKICYGDHVEISVTADQNQNETTNYDRKTSRRMSLAIENSKNNDLRVQLKQRRMSVDSLLSMA